ncbi:MgtC/SapB family protein [Desulfobacter hydrogenophilus]|uniref:MgtC/SapB family protein n=1 Tax=Desulfobacter hydrogenophilus TaxID=2291 RepID=A0A328FG74_9BACT|nr:MgtC/SapB family protein [Desulfobacter hydrogenophilus]NDY70621.1 MgtC/SapB family protein [Desulfobacter hydrogenophilus]QBH13989.1 MgtC/SapB family protein [Desulfobacter hydrogenophilus]RAM03598.1 MgtC/SapB family protein [Desulfobacter hydrogenophilus]
MENFQIEWQLVYDHSLHLVFAYLLALPIGWDRERSSRNFGLRTFPLVAVVTCGYMLVGISVIDSTGGEARVIQGILTGIGFIGGGAILTDRDKVSGTASAASIWNTGAIGVAVVVNRYEIAVMLSFLNVITLFFFSKLKDEMRSDENT